MLSALLATGCSAVVAAPTPVPTVIEPAPLARFMRERMNVPFAFAMIESQGANRPIRVRLAATVLEQAAHHLVTWKDPPVATDAAREVFFEYARNLQRGVARFERSLAQRDLDAAATDLDGIRATCNSCHRFFRPTSTSHDVGFDLSTFHGGAGPW